MFAAAILEALLWASAYLAVGGFEGLESAFYFSLVVFTTLGFGDIVLDPAWRILTAIEAVNGIMMFGWTTALNFWFMQRLVRQVIHHEEAMSRVDGAVSTDSDRSAGDPS